MTRTAVVDGKGEGVKVDAVDVNALLPITVIIGDDVGGGGGGGGGGVGDGFLASCVSQGLFYALTNKPRDYTT